MMKISAVGFLLSTQLSSQDESNLIPPGGWEQQNATNY